MLSSLGGFDVRTVSASAFGEHAFRRWVPEKRLWKKQVLAALFDAEMFGVARFDIDELRANSEALTNGLKQLFSRSDFRQSIDAATNTPNLFRHRIEATIQMISNVIR